MKDFLWNMFFFVIAGFLVVFIVSSVAASITSSVWEIDAVNNGVGTFVVDKYGKASFQWVKPQPTTQAK